MLIFLLFYLIFNSDPAISALKFLDVVNMKDTQQKSQFYKTTLIEAMPLIPRVSDAQSIFPGVSFSTGTGCNRFHKFLFFFGGFVRFFGRTNWQRINHLRRQVVRFMAKQFVNYEPFYDSYKNVAAPANECPLFSHQPSATGNRQPATGSRQLATGDWRLTTVRITEGLVSKVFVGPIVRCR